MSGKRHTPEEWTDPIGRVEREIAVLARRVELARATSQPDERLVRSAYLLLSELEAAGPLGVAGLAAAGHVDISTVSRQVVPLEEGHLVQRLPNPADGRSTLIEITDRGRETLERARRERHERYDALLADWTDEDRDAFAGYLERFNAALIAKFESRTGR